ncbi:lipopolysaccharide assembly protein LapB [Plantactinospora sp. BC1]|uniref:tetratricopeptide repeat protein n=1 Tax=Plantactinospora sp. BC1 TaxID=2108470 RepID=UPI00131ED973|nr:tetratricopeptide repeat protein [Plantactinospora sp. BC1]
MSELPRPSAAQAYQRARLLADSGRYDDAERQIRSGLAVEPDDPDSLVFLAYLLRVRERYVEALAACDAAVAAAPGHAEAYVERAEALVAVFRGEAAVRAATEAVRLDPGAPRTHRSLARALAFTEEYDRARYAVRQALALDPGSVDSLLTLAALERDAGNRGAAEQAVRAALRHEPDNAHGRRLLAMLDADRWRVGRSMRILRAVAAQHPADPDPVAMVWPLRRALTGPCRWLSGGAVLLAVAAPLAAGPLPAPAGILGRLAAALLAVAVVAVQFRVLAPAGRTPWRCLRLVPRLLRTALGLGLLVSTALLGLLVGYAGTGWWPLPLIALALVPPLWACVLAERIGAHADDPGLHQAARDIGSGFAQWWAELRQWWTETRRDLRTAWQEPAAVPPTVDGTGGGVGSGDAREGDR